MNRVSRSVFRSLLRWTRRPELSSTAFTLYPRELGVAHLLPPNTVLKGVEDVQGALYHGFRKGSFQDLDVAFSLMKQLNEIHAKLKEEYQQRLSNQDPNNVQYATYRIGEVVQMTHNKVRGVVVSWEIDAVAKAQRLKLLLDGPDMDEKSTRLRPDHKLDSRDIERVTNPLLQRINNENISTFFYYFDESTRRYVPRDELQQLFPKDFEGIKFGKLLQSEVEQKAAQSLTQGIATLGQHLQYILEEEFPSLLLPEDHPQLRNLTDQQINERIITQQILDEIIPQIQGLITPHPSSSSPDTATPSSSIAVKLLRGGKYRLQPSSPSLPIQFDFSEKDQIAIETVYGAAFNLQELIRTMYQLLQLRFQSRGVAFVDRLRLQHLDSGQVKIAAIPLSSKIDAMDKETHSTPIFEVGQVVRSKKNGFRAVVSGYDIRPLMDVSKWECVKDSPLGMNQPFYRVVIDQADFEALPEFERYHTRSYIAQDNLELVEDPSSRIVNHKLLSKRFLGWDTDTSRFRVPHKLKYCFPCGPHKFPADYPDTTVWTQWQAQCPPADDVSEDDKTLDQLKQDIIATEIKIYEKVDRTVLDMYQQISTMLGQTRQHYLAQKANTPDANSTNHLHFTAEDIFTLLQKAPSREAAFGMKIVLWNVWGTHTNHNVSAAHRLGASAMHRADFDTAFKAFTETVEHDLSFSEGHSKLAGICYKQGKYQECVGHALDSLKHFPDHLDTWCILALAYEKLGNVEEAKIAINEALRIDPWVPSIPTILQSFLEKESEKNKKEAEDTPKDDSDDDDNDDDDEDEEGPVKEDDTMFLDKEKKSD